MSDEAAPISPAAEAHVNKSAVDQARSRSVAAAWAAVEQKMGPVDHDEPFVASGAPEDKPAEAAQDGDKPPAPKPKPKPAPAAAKEAEEPPARVPDLVHERRKLRESFQRKEQELHQSFAAREKAVTESEARIAPLVRALEHANSGDPDGLARCFAEAMGFDEVSTWDQFQGEMLKIVQSPVYKDHRKLKLDIERERKAREEGEKQARQQASQREAEQLQRNHIKTLGDTISEDEDPALQSILDVDPNFSQMMFNHQRAHYHETEETLSPRDAAVATLKSLVPNLKKWNDFLAEHADSPIVQMVMGTAGPNGTTKKNGTAGRNGAQQTNGSANRNGVRQGNGKPPPTVSQNRTAEAAAVARPSDTELKRRFASQMQEAAKTDPMFVGRP